MKRPTCRALRDYFDSLCQLGHGEYEVAIDWRSVPCRRSVCQIDSIRPPAPERRVDTENRVVLIDVQMEP